MVRSFLLDRLRLGTMFLLLVLSVTSETIDLEHILGQYLDQSSNRSRSSSSSKSNSLDLGHVSVDETLETNAAICLPCYCHKIHGRSNDSFFVVDCSGRKLTEVPTNLPDSTTMNFSSNLLRNDDASLRLCEKYISLRTVSLAWNGLTSLPTSLQGCQNSLDELTLTGNWLTVTGGSSSFQELQSLRSLQGLWIRNKLQPTAFSALTALSRMEVTYAASTVPGSLFQPLTRLRVLHLTLPDVQGLPADLVLPAGLEELYLKGNKLKHLPSGPLKDLVKLTALHLDLPELRRLAWTPADVFTSQLKHMSATGVWEITSESLALMTSLTFLRLEGIRTLTDTAFFDYLAELTSLEIVNCSLGSSPLQWITKPRGLTSMALKKVQLAELPPDILSGLTALQSLDLSSNNLKQIPDDFLLPVSTTLEGLDLSSNLLDHLNVTTFPFMPSLKVLDLSRNRLTSLDLDAFVNTPNLSQLMLHGNALSLVEGDEIGESLRRLDLLDLSSNLLETIPAGVPLKKVSTLDMSNNLLTRGLPFDRLMSFTQAVVVELEATPIACNCEVHKLVAQGILIGGVCNSPPSMSGKPTENDSMYTLCLGTNSDETVTSETSVVDPHLTTVTNPETTSYETLEDFDWMEGSITRTFGPAMVFNNVKATSVTGTMQYMTTSTVSQSFNFNGLLLRNERVDQITTEKPFDVDEDNVDVHNKTSSGQVIATTTRRNVSDNISKSRDATESTHQGHGHGHGHSPTDKSGHGTELGVTHGDEPGPNNTDTLIGNLSSPTSAPPYVWDFSVENDDGPLNMSSAVDGNGNRIGRQGGGVVETTSEPTPETADTGFPHLPWVVALCLLLTFLGFGYVVCRRTLRSGSQTLADDMSTDNKALRYGKMELMELGVAPRGQMPVIM